MSGLRSKLYAFIASRKGHGFIELHWKISHIETHQKGKKDRNLVKVNSTVDNMPNRQKY